MKNKAYIYEEIKALRVKDDSYTKGVFGTKKKINELCNILTDKEELNYILTGTYNNTTCLIALTDSRVILLAKGLIHRIKQREIKLKDIVFFDCQKEKNSGKICLLDGEQDIVYLEKLNIDDMDVFADKVNALMIKYNPPKEGNNDKKEDFLKQLKELGHLRKQGLLTEEEFTKAKIKLVSLY